MRAPVVLGLAVVVSAGAGGVRRAAAQQIPIRLGGFTSSLVGVPFDVPLEVDMSARSDKLGSFSLTLRWNPARLQFVSGQPGNFGDLRSSPDSVAADSGVIRLTGVNPAGVGGHVVLGIARFMPLTTTADTFKLNVTELYAAGTFADLLPSATWGDRAYCNALGRYGDMNGDGIVNSGDALEVLTYATGATIPHSPTPGDVDGDGVTGARDALIMLASGIQLDVSGFRVYLPVPGACAALQRPLLALTPGNVTLDLGQRVRYAAYATDSTGATVAVTDLAWSSSNPGVATVDSAGQVSAVAAGTTTVAVRRTSGTNASVVVTVLARHTHWVDAFANPDPTNELGAPQLPFRSIAQGLAYARPGDTVRVRPARYDEAPQITQRVTLIGDTTPSGTRPLLVPPNPNAYTGINVTATTSVAIENLAIEGFETGVLSSATMDTLLAEGLRVLLPAGICGSAIEVTSPTTLIVRGSQLVGDGQIYGCASGVQVDGVAQTVVLQNDRITDFGYYGLYVSSADSVAVLGSELSENYYGMFADAQTNLALVVDQSRFKDNYYNGIQAQDLRAAVVSHSVVGDSVYYDNAMTLYGDQNGAGYVRVVGDSIRTAGQDWIDAYGLDSVVVDSLRVWGQTGDGYFSSVSLVRVTTSSFEAMYYYASAINANGGRVVVDSVSVTGSPTCSRCSYGIEAYQSPVSVNRFAGSNLNYGLYVSDSSATLTSSAFTNVYAGVYAYSSTARPRVAVRHVNMNGTYYGVETYNTVTVVDSSTFTSGGGYDEGVYTYGGGVDTVRYNTATGLDYAFELDDTLAYAANNTVNAPRSEGFYQAASTALPTDTSLFLNNTVVCDSYGAANVGGIEVYTTSHRVQGNTVTGCNWGIYGQADTSLRAIVRGNTVSVPSAATYPGIEEYAYGRMEVVGNTVIGGGPSNGGAIVLQSGVPRAKFARADSNLVQAPQAYGIFAASVDSLVVRGNTIEDLTEPCCSTNPGGISLGQVTYGARVVGNTLRRMHGAGVSINQSTDTATAKVDSNAVSAADTAAVRVLAGNLTMTGNNIQNNVRDGLSILPLYGVYSVHSNAFKGNGRYAVASTSNSTVDATQNWWGVDGGVPPGQAGADSVSGIIDASAPLSTAPSGLPALAPPPLIASAAAATSVRLPTLAAPVAVTSDANVNARPRAASMVPPRSAAPQPRIPSRGRLAARMAATVRSMQQRRAERDAQRAAQATAREARTSDAAARQQARDARRAKRQAVRQTASPERAKQ
jgi:hypothetical protein